MKLFNCLPFYSNNDGISICFLSCTNSDPNLYLLEDDSFGIHSLKVGCFGNLLVRAILNGLSRLQSHSSVNEASTIVDSDHLLKQPGEKEATDAWSTAEVEGAGLRPVNLLHGPLNQAQQRQCIALRLDMKE